MARVSAREVLLNEGITSYLDTAAALRAFRQEVVRVCRAELGRALPRIEHALKQKIQRGSVLDYAEPRGRGEALLDPEYAWLGVTFDLPKTGSFHFGMGWWSDEDGVAPSPRAAASLWLGGQDKAKRFGRALSKYSPGRIVGPKPGESELSVELPIKPPTSRSLERTLRGCLKVWVDAWKRGGGLSKIRKAAKV